MIGLQKTQEQRTILIGTSPEAALVATFLKPAAMRVAAGAKSPLSLEKTLWFEALPDARAYASQYPVSAVFADPSTVREYRQLATVGREVPIQSVVTELERLLGRASASGSADLGEYLSIVNSTSKWEVVARRIVEIALAVLLLILTVPILIFMRLALALVFGPSRLLASREVVGKGGERFDFVTLGIGSSKLKPDSRRYAVLSAINRNVRRLHFDLAPSFLHVLSGKMGVVGPRPDSPEQVERGMALTPVYAARALVAPGIISHARVRYTNSASAFDERRALEYDLFYIKHRSLWLDIRTVARASVILVWDITRTLGQGLVSAFILLGRWGRRIIRGGTPGPSNLVTVPMPTGPNGEPLDLKPTLLIGAGQGGEMLVRELQSNYGANLWPVAFVDDDLSRVGNRVCGVPVLGTTDTIPAIVEREHIESIVVAIPSASPIALQRIIGVARDTGLPVLSMPGIRQILRGEEATVLKAVPTSDLLGRPVVETDATRARQFLGGKRVLVTGAAGSIGREVVLQALRGEPATIYGLDINESDLYDLQQELKARKLTTEFIPVVASVIDTRYLNRLMDQIQPNVVFHAAAYKHVPLMEDYPHEAIQTNIKGTWNVAQASARLGVERFVLVSTDKAVRPSSVMGASKRIAEIVVRDIAMTTGLSACAVRFGNVLGSRGSVIPLFERQIAAGGPVTITDRRMTRYFMTIPEAAGLIIEAGAFGDFGVIYMLDMGEPVKIVDVAERLISLHGKRPGIDIPVTYSGLRPGEKLFEELSLDFEAARETGHSKIRILDEGNVEHRQSAERMMQRLLDIIEHGSPGQIREAIMVKVQQADGVELSLVSAESVPRKIESA